MSCWGGHTPRGATAATANEPPIKLTIDSDNAFWALLAGALPAGITVAAVARQLGVSRSWASREANAPGTRLLIAQLLAPHRERLSVLFDKTLDVIEDALKARKTYLVRGVLVDGGPAHYARLEAGRLFIRLISSRR
jgi:hypothetical protein